MAAYYVGEVSFPAQGHIFGNIVHRIVTGDASAMFPRSSGGGSISPVLVWRPLGGGPTLGVFAPSGHLIATLTGARGSVCLGGGRPHPRGVLRWINLLLVRGHLAHLVPS